MIFLILFPKANFCQIDQPKKFPKDHAENDTSKSQTFFLNEALPHVASCIPIYTA
jgi:hypothetical protein